MELIYLDFTKVPTYDVYTNAETQVSGASKVKQRYNPHRYLSKSAAKKVCFYCYRVIKPLLLSFLLYLHTDFVSFILPKFQNFFATKVY